MASLKILHVKKLPDESCRHCGFAIKPWSKCQYCMKTIQQICTNCNTVTAVQFHSECDVLLKATVMVKN